MKLLTLLSALFFLLSCGGGNGISSTDFSRDELLNTMIISKSVFDHRLGVEEKGEASMILFNDNKLREFSLSHYVSKSGTQGSRVEFEDLQWSVLSNGKIQLDYPNDVICTMEKLSASIEAIDILGQCSLSGGTVEETFLKPLPFTAEMLAGKKIAYAFETEYPSIFTFNDDETFSYGDIPGRIVKSIYKNGLRLEFIDNRFLDYSILFLLEGDLENGTLIEIEYTKSNNGKKFNMIRLLSVSENEWFTERYFEIRRD